MLQVEYLRHQSDALLRLSREVEEPECLSEEFLNHMNHV